MIYIVYALAMHNQCSYLFKVFIMNALQKTLVLNMQHQEGVKLAVLIFGVGLTPLGVNTKSKIARFGTFFCRSK